MFSTLKLYIIYDHHRAKPVLIGYDNMIKSVSSGKPDFSLNGRNGQFMKTVQSKLPVLLLHFTPMKATVCLPFFKLHFL